MDDVAEIIQRLAGEGHRVTSPRLAIVRSVARRHGHFSAQEIWADLSGVDGTIGRATVFRTLDLLSTLGVVDRLPTEDGSHRYHVTVDAGHHHHHLVCAICGGVETLSSELVERLVHQVASSAGYELLSHQIELVGRCPACQKVGLNEAIAIGTF